MTDEEIIEKRDELQKIIDRYNEEIAENCRKFFNGEFDIDDLKYYNDLLNSKINGTKSSIAKLALKR